MAERIKRTDDEGLYQPSIHSVRIRELYQIKERTGLPLTVLLDRAIEAYVARFQEDENGGEQQHDDKTLADR